MVNMAMFILYEHFGDFPAMAMMTRVLGKPIFLCQKNTMMIQSYPY